MNINQLKAFLSDKPAHLGSESSVQNQLRDSGLRQAAALQANQSAASADKFSSSASFGARIYENALNTTLEINSKKPNFAAKNSSQTAKPLFDFEEVAKNVLKFVGSAIKSAKNSGADETKLKELFEQATSGVLKGIKMAEKDLAGLMSEEIRTGIDNSKKLIDEGIESLRKDVFSQDKNLEANGTKTVQTATQISVARQQSAQLVIKTKEGDSVTLSFEDFRKFELNQQVLIQQRNAVNEQEQPASRASNLPPEQVVEGAQSNKPEQANSAGSTGNSSAADQNKNTEANAGAAVKSPAESSVEVKSQQNSIYYQSNAVSFSVSGELNDNELKAIGQLVPDANSLADEFFNGDIEIAYNQALKLGFDEKELTGFALQLTKVESSQVVKTYESVSHYGQNEANSDPAKAVKPIAQYLDKMLSVVEDSRDLLQGSQDYENMINTLINRMGEVHTPDLITALNRFHGFNQKLMDNLPLIRQ